MYNSSFTNASPLVNALAQTALLLLIPLVISIVLGGIAGMQLYFNRHPLLSRGTKQLPFAKMPHCNLYSYVYIGFLPLLLLVLNQLLRFNMFSMSIIFITVGSCLHLIYRVVYDLNQLDASVLETALSCGLSTKDIIFRVLLPQGKQRLLYAITETALFTLVLVSVTGSVCGFGLSSLVIGGIDSKDSVWSLMILAVLFIGFLALTSRFAKSRFH